MSFRVRVTWTTDPTVTATHVMDLTVPQTHGATLTADRPALGTTPGTAANVALTLKSVGNVAETVTLTATLPTGLALGGRTGTVPLALGGSQTLNLTLTPDANVPLDSTLSVTITATFGPGGELGTQTLTIPIRVVAPGADAAATGAGSASQAGLTDLSNRLTDLATGITNRFQPTGSAVFNAQVLAAVAGRVAAVSPTEVRAALDHVGDYLNSSAASCAASPVTSG